MLNARRMRWRNKFRITAIEWRRTCGIAHIHMRNLVVAHGESRRSHGLQRVATKLIAHRKKPRFTQRAIEIHGLRGGFNAIFTEHNWTRMARSAFIKQAANNAIHLAKFRSKDGRVGTFALQHIVKVRNINQRERWIMFAHHVHGGARDPIATAYAGAWTPEIKQRKCAKFFLKRVAKRVGLRGNIWNFAAVVRVDRPRRDGDVAGGIHVEPPK